MKKLLLVCIAACFTSCLFAAQIVLEKPNFAGNFQLLLNYRLQEAASRDDYEYIEKLVALHEEKAEINSQNENGLTALHIAAHEGHKASVEMLLHYNACTTILDAEGNTPLVYAKAQKHEAIIALLQHPEPKSPEENQDCIAIILHTPAACSPNSERIKKLNILQKWLACLWPCFKINRNT